MDFNTYQNEAKKTIKFSRFPYVLKGFPTEFNQTNEAIDDVYDFCNLGYTVLGLTGEAGEIANKVKKIWRDNDGNISEEHEKMILDEAGDVLWYLSALCSTLDINLNDVAENNIKKLHDRLERNVISGSGDNR